MKQSLDEVRTLAVKLFEASRVEMRRQPKSIWHDATRNAKFHDLPSESVSVWDAVAIEAIKALRAKAVSKTV